MCPTYVKFLNCLNLFVHLIKNSNLNTMTIKIYVWHLRAGRLVVAPTPKAIKSVTEVMVMATPAAGSGGPRAPGRAPVSSVYTF